MATQEGGSAAVFGRGAQPRVPLPQRGVVLGLAWSGVEGAGSQIACAKVELARGRPELARVWRPFQERPGRKDVSARFPHWLGEEARWAEGRLCVGLDFPFSLAETHLRQLGLLRQAIRGPVALGKGLAEKFLVPGADHSAAAEAFRAELGMDRARLTDGYRAVSWPPTHARLFRQTFFGLAVLSHVAEASFLPWDPPRPGRTSLVEVRPEHAARVLSGGGPYRDEGRGGVKRASARAALLRTVRGATGMEFEMEVVARVVEDGKGIFLDAVLAAVAAGAAWEDGFRGVPPAVPRSEGWIHSVREEPWRGP
jgi:hypothetical protein